MVYEKKSREIEFQHRGCGDEEIEGTNSDFLSTTWFHGEEIGSQLDWRLLEE